ncbi:MAG TPA: hypothetical protein VM597_38155 [Gemmataceae bacterium]|nr:hypothetical protein [Gemmataceae bacterium]
MALSPDGFLRRLRSGEVVNCLYRKGELAGLISGWPHAGAFVLTWEECRDGDQFNENAYTRDERHRFETAEQVLAFVKQAGYPASAFRP